MDPPNMTNLIQFTTERSPKSRYLDRSLQVLEVPPEAIQEDLEVEPGTRCKFLLLKTRGFFQVTSATN